MRLKKIGTRKQENLSFRLAPMEGVSEFPFRLFLSPSSPDWMTTLFFRITEGFPIKNSQNFGPQSFL